MNSAILFLHGHQESTVEFFKFTVGSKRIIYLLEVVLWIDEAVVLICFYYSLQATMFRFEFRTVVDCFFFFFFFVAFLRFSQLLWTYYHHFIICKRIPTFLMLPIWTVQQIITATFPIRFIKQGICLVVTNFKSSAGFISI